MNTQRITVTLPPHLVDAIDQHETNRSRFVAEAVERELERRRREGLYESLRNPHSETLDVAEGDFDHWAANLPAEADDLVDSERGRPIRWREGEGWQSADRTVSGPSATGPSTTGSEPAEPEPADRQTIDRSGDRGRE